METLETLCKAVMLYTGMKRDKAERYVRSCITEYRHGNITAFIDLKEMVEHYYKRKGM